MHIIRSASIFERKECRRIKERIDHYIPKRYAQTIFERLKKKNIDVSISEIYNTRQLRIYRLVIWRELEAWVNELYPDDLE